MSNQGDVQIMILTLYFFIHKAYCYSILSVMLTLSRTEKVKICKEILFNLISIIQNQELLKDNNKS
jgi:hypothetical protein